MLSRTDGEKCQDHDGKQRTQSDKKPVFFTDDTKYHVGVGCDDIFQPAASGTFAEHTAGGSCRHGTGLLISGTVNVLPCMSPSGKTLGDVWLN